MDNVAGGMAVTAQEFFQRVVEQIGGMDVDLHHAVDHRAERYSRLLRHPVAGVVDDGPQAAGMRFNRFGKGQNAVIAAEVGLQTEGARFAQVFDRRIGRAIADDHRLVLLQKMVRQREADAAASSCDQNRAGLLFSHGYLLCVLRQGERLPHQHPRCRHSGNQQ